MLSPQYIAGFFDGEGYITMRRSNRHLSTLSGKKRTPTYLIVVGFTNTDLGILQLIQEVCNGRIYPKPRQNERHAPAYELTIFKKEHARNFLEIIGPHVVLKSPQIKLASEFFALGKSRIDFTPRGKTWPGRSANSEDSEVKESYKQRLSDMNRRGPECPR